MEKILGKIEAVNFGHCGYQECCLGLSVSLSMDGSGVADSKAYWDAELISSKNANWSESDRDKGYAEVMRYVSKLLADAKVHSVDKLKGIPVEVTLDGNCLKSWRVLTEVV